MIVYLDILLIENFIVNFFLLYITIKSLSIEVNYKRLLASSMLGALYVITYFYNFNGILNSLPLKLIIGYLLVAIVLKENTIGIKIKGSILYLLYTVLLAGICFFLAQNSKVYIYRGFIFNFSSKKLLLSLILIFFLLDRMYKFIKDSLFVNKFIYDMELILGDEIIKLKGFLDTGNELREPITNLPVVFIESTVIDKKLIDENQMITISYKVVNNRKFEVKAFKPKALIVHRGEEKKVVDCFIALSKGSLSNENKFNALLSRGVIY
ncbi:sigma-E processing peptidase SpoIIGA [Clostridium bornimense]|uniref:sigma-E processing peptidase SpoIIGA n=1 Tax=Clostridium bornimense TaxID=1216932 RepID=UPI001C120DF0|nr:sigma-E processing peptidase SpoIIGA [Clostridium bornimense]MBU5317109.1 sigma-E processing peptidase SpoIIGA [Clostridium bornimense]